MSQIEWIRCYMREFQQKVEGLSASQAGAYFRLWLYQAENGRIPIEMIAISSIIGEPLELSQRLWGGVVKLFQLDPDGYFDPGVDAQRSNRLLAKERQSAGGRKAMEKRWSASKPKTTRKPDPPAEKPDRQVRLERLCEAWNREAEARKDIKGVVASGKRLNEVWKRAWSKDPEGLSEATQDPIEWLANELDNLNPELGPWARSLPTLLESVTGKPTRIKLVALMQGEYRSRSVVQQQQQQSRPSMRETLEQSARAKQIKEQMEARARERANHVKAPAT